MGSKLDQLKALRSEREQKGAKQDDSLPATSPDSAGTSPEGRDSATSDETNRRPTNDQGSATASGNEAKQGGDEQENKQAPKDDETFEPVKVTEFADALGLDAAELYDLPLAVGEGSATLGDVLRSYQDQSKIEARTSEMQTFEYNVQNDIGTAMQLADEIGHRWSPQMQQALADKERRDHQMNVSVMQRMFPDMATADGAKSYVERVTAYGRTFGISPERLSAPQNWQEVAVFRHAMDTSEENKVLKEELAALRNAATANKNAKARKSSPKIRRPGATGSVNGLATEKRNAIAGDKAAKARYMQAFRDRSQKPR